jgi:hypothetical protein
MLEILGRDYESDDAMTEYPFIKRPKKQVVG